MIYYVPIGRYEWPNGDADDFDELSYSSFVDKALADEAAEAMKTANGYHYATYVIAVEVEKQ